MRRPRTVTVVLSIVVAMLAGGLAVFLLGTPQAPAPAATTVAQGTAPGAAVASPATPADSSPLAIEIPGCVCHSDDPVVVEEHAAYRMSECAACHSGGTPEMGQ